MEMEVVGQVRFKDRVLPVYGDLNEPLFNAKDIVDLIGYSKGNAWNLLQLCEPERIVRGTIWTGGQRRSVNLVTEAGLYDILAQSRQSMALIWRHVIIEQLVAIRKQRGLTIVEQFDEWDQMAESLYWDEERNCLMRSVTIEGGDVEQIPYEPGEDAQI